MAQSTHSPRLRPAAYVCLLASIHGLAIAASIDERVQTALNREYPSLARLYEDLHAHPELSYHEERTARKLAGELSQLGLDVTTKVGTNGVVGVLRNGPGPTILVRADLDALPVKEQTGLAYASHARATNDLGIEVDVMHACGHDLHITALVGTARLLARLKDAWSGTAVFIGQPAEERSGGAKAMLADGLFTRFPQPDFCLALHVNAELPAGAIGVAEGFFMANVDALDITIRGVGGHGAWPHKTKDPIVLAAETVIALQTIVSRETDPLDSAVVTVGSIHGGTKHNVIPDEVKLEVTVRSLTDDVRTHTLEAIKRIVRGQAIAAGIPEARLPLVEPHEEPLPALYNNPELTRTLAAVFRDLLGEKNVVNRRPSMGGEDFSEYGRTAKKVPICMFWLGSVEPERIKQSERSGQALPSLHSSLYHPQPEPTITIGVRAMTAAVMHLAAKK